MHPIMHSAHTRPWRGIVWGQERSTFTALPTVSLISGSDANGPDARVFDRTRDASANMSETHVAGRISVSPCEGSKCQFMLLKVLYIQFKSHFNGRFQFMDAVV